MRSFSPLNMLQDVICHFFVYVYLPLKWYVGFYYLSLVSLTTDRAQLTCVSVYTNKGLCSNTDASAIEN